jgi:phosphoglycerate dehydrogenase-like enzyme
MSEPIHVLITLPFSEKLVSEFQNTSPRLKLTVRSAKTAEEIDPAIWEKTEILYTADILPAPDAVPALRWIQFHWAGIDSLVQAPILQKEDLLATTISGANASQVAEHVLMMLLALGHHLPAHFELKQRAEWPKDRWKRFSPLELRDRLVGIVGYGSIGRQVARLLSAFGAVVLGTKRDAMDPEDSGYFPQELGDPGGDLVHRLYPPEALRSMLKESDFVVISTPLTPETRHLIGAEALAACKPGAYLIDISRGGIVDHDALIKALQTGQLAGAALDVFPKEPLPADSPLWKMPNVILTPHISGVASSYDQRAAALFTENLYRYLANLPLFNLIDLTRGY